MISGSRSRVIAIPVGFRAAAVKAGIKPSGGLDLAVLAADGPCAAAGTFTTNRVCAAPVQLGPRAASRPSESAPSSSTRATPTRRPGRRARRTPGAPPRSRPRRSAARPTQVLVASTGVIGHQLPMDRLEAGLGRGPGRRSRPTRRAFRRGVAGDPDDRHAPQGRLASRRTIGGRDGHAARPGQGGRDDRAEDGHDARLPADRRPRRRRRPPGDPLRGGRGVVQLHLGRGAHEHQRHRPAAGQRRAAAASRSRARTWRSSPRWSASRAVTSPG